MLKSIDQCWGWGRRHMEVSVNVCDAVVVNFRDAMWSRRCGIALALACRHYLLFAVDVAADNWAQFLLLLLRQQQQQRRHNCAQLPNTGCFTFHFISLRVFLLCYFQSFFAVTSVVVVVVIARRFWIIWLSLLCPIIARHRCCFCCCRVLLLSLPNASPTPNESNLCSYATVDRRYMQLIYQSGKPVRNWLTMYGKNTTHFLFINKNSISFLLNHCNECPLCACVCVRVFALCEFCTL